MKSLLALLLLATSAFAADDLDIKIAMAMAVLPMKPAQTGHKEVPAETPPAYTWRANPTVRQFGLFRGEVQIGAWRQDDGIYLSCESGAWVVAESPAELPKVRIGEQPGVAARKADRQVNNTLAAWQSLPLNHGSCPCGKTGGCHCDPHSSCAAGRCAEHNPLLSAKPAVQQTMPVYLPAQR